MQTEAIPESRTYRHSKCNEETTISGQPFEVMSNPLSDMTRTWCTQCNDYFPISEYAWSDTGESIPDYYARHSANASSLQRFLCSKKCMIFLALTGFLLVAIVAFVLFASSALWLRIVLAIRWTFRCICRLHFRTLWPNHTRLRCRYSDFEIAEVLSRTCSSSGACSSHLDFSFSVGWLADVVRLQRTDLSAFNVTV